IRYYIAEGLLPGPEGRGKATVYGEEHFQRLRLIRLLSLQHMPLAEMSQLLNRLSLAEVHALLAEEELRVRQLEQMGRQPEPQEYIATLLKNAQAFRQAPPQAPAAYPLPAPVQPSVERVQEASKVYEVKRVPPGGESWRRWELA